jgi:2-polyprenyl-3-methyl-5-hydroxy-6-metoxy-1,4-benzoquinol methylase
MSRKQNLNDIASTYHSDAPLDIEIENSIQIYEFPWISKFICPDMKILDLGIGDGIVLNLLVNHMTNFVFDLKILEGSSVLCQNFHGFNNDKVKIENVLFENFETDDRYDLIIMSHVLEHVENPIDILKKYKSLLSENGKIIGIVPNSQSIHRRLAVYMGIQEFLDSLSPRDIMVGHLRVYSIETLESDLNKSGLVCEEIKGFFFKPLSNKQLMQLEANLIPALLKVSEEIPPELCANVGFVAKKF